MAFKHGHELTAAIQQLFAAGPADLAVAYWGTDACTKLRLPADLSRYRIVCDAYSGFCSPYALKELLERRAEIVDMPKLHAKVYKTSSTLIVTSANASSRGLDEDRLAGFGLETGVVDTAPDRLAGAAKWFETVFAAGTPVGAADLAEIKKIWDRQRAGRVLRTTLVDAILTASGALADRDLRVYLYTADEPSIGLQSRFKKTRYYDRDRWEKGRGYPFFWGEMPSSVSLGDELLCFEIDGGKATSEGVWKILDRLGSGHNTIWPAVEIDRPFGRKLGSTDEMDRRVGDALRANRLRVDADPISLTAFAAAISDSRAEAGHLARIKSPDARAAYRYLVDHSSALGLVPSYKTGRVPALKWHDARGRYLFSFIPNQSDLLFYLRQPALAAAPHLDAHARKLGLDCSLNPSGEVTVRLRTAKDAAAVTAWLKTMLPLPQ